MKNNRFKLMVLALSALWSLALLSPARAAESDKIILTISPPLIKNKMNPGDSWAATIKLLNNGEEAVTVYARAVDFKSGPEGGVELLGVEENDEQDVAAIKKYSLSRWIDIEHDPIVLAAHQSVQVPFAIKLPPDAEPGGHYAAIMVGNKPAEKIEGSGLKVSSFLSSLILLEVAGKTIEKGVISEFSTDKNFYQSANVKFNLRIENEGTIHFQPKGEIKIYDMWGEEKATLPFNENQGNFGNVLPQSTRKWNLEWNGKVSLAQMGRYKASVVIAYGEEIKENIDKDTYFWIINFKIIGLISGVLALVIIMIVLMVKLSIKRALKDTQKMLVKSEDALPAITAPAELPAEAKVSPSVKKVVDLREKMKEIKSKNKQ